MTEEKTDTGLDNTYLEKKAIKDESLLSKEDSQVEPAREEEKAVASVSEEEEKPVGDEITLEAPSEASAAVTLVQDEPRKETLEPSVAKKEIDEQQNERAEPLLEKPQKDTIEPPSEKIEAEKVKELPLEKKVVEKMRQEEQKPQKLESKPEEKPERSKKEVELKIELPKQQAEEKPPVKVKVEEKAVAPKKMDEKQPVMKKEVEEKLKAKTEDKIKPKEVFTFQLEFELCRYLTHVLHYMVWSQACYKHGHRFTHLPSVEEKKIHPETIEIGL